RELVKAAPEWQADRRAGIIEDILEGATKQHDSTKPAKRPSPNVTTEKGQAFMHIEPEFGTKKSLVFLRDDEGRTLAMDSEDLKFAKHRLTVAGHLAVQVGGDATEIGKTLDETWFRHQDVQRLLAAAKANAKPQEVKQETLDERDERLL